MIPMLTISIVVVLLACALLREQLTARRLIGQSWEGLLSELAPTETASLSLIAVEFLTPDRAPLRTEPAERWAMVGGWKGLKQLRANADVLIALAAHAERWMPLESKSVVAQMRAQSITLRREARYLTLERLVGYEVKGSGYRVQRAASAYHLMVTCLINLYHVIPSHRSEILDAAIWGLNLHHHL